VLLPATFRNRFHSCAGNFLAKLPPRPAIGPEDRGWQSDIHHLDSKRFHQMENSIFSSMGIVNRGVLQAVPQGFVIERDFPRGGKDEIAAVFNRRSGDLLSSSAGFNSVRLLIAQRITVRHLLRVGFI